MGPQRSANAVSGKTARACDSCLRCRARWYCAADDAFLCQSCDSSVHSANTLARRHERVRLKTSSSSPSSSSLLTLPPPSDLNSALLPTWHQGFKRKLRTPRQAKKPVLLVPDLEALAEGEDNNNVINEAGDETEVHEEEEELLYRVPIFDPVLAEFCCPPLIHEEAKPAMNKLILPAENQTHGFTAGFNPSDIELAEFAADVENLLGHGLDDNSFCIDGLGLLEAREDDRSQVKMELMDAIDTSGGVNNTNFLADIEMEFSRESLDFNFDCGSPTAGGDHEPEVQKVETVEEVDRSGPKIGLRLDYDAVIAEWSCRGCSPWTDGERPQFNPDDCWPDFMGMWGAVGGGELQGSYGEVGIGGQVGNWDGGREARVWRYREKRRTRLFSKKIRYEVRKLNAEKRPRLKGRFVKRASFPVAAVAVAGGFPYV